MENGLNRDEGNVSEEGYGSEGSWQKARQGEKWAHGEDGADTVGIQRSLQRAQPGPEPQESDSSQAGPMD